ncbi:hypothetical protein [Aminobacter ciceronei]|nr:hypothetical protein [Aminobacter ciceronei]
MRRDDSGLAEVLQLRAGTHPGELRVPPGNTIAYQLIHAWADEG